MNSSCFCNAASFIEHSELFLIILRSSKEDVHPLDKHNDTVFCVLNPCGVFSETRA